MKSSQRMIQCWMASMSLLGLVACGGASTSTDPPAASATAIDQQSAELSIVLDVPQNGEDRRRIALTWQAQGATTFAVRIEREAGAGFAPIDASIAGKAAQFARGPGWKFDFPTARVQVRACDAAQRCVDSNAQPLEGVLMASLDRVFPIAGFGNIASFYNMLAISDDGNVLASVTTFPAGENSESTVFVHRRNASGRWVREAQLDRSGFPGALGQVLALSGDGRTLVVEAGSNGGSVGGVNPPEVGTPPRGESRPGDYSGAVYVYQRDAQQGWQLQAYLKATQPVDLGRFGRDLTVSRSGDRLVVADQVGQMHVFTRTGSTWSTGKAMRLRGEGSRPAQLSMAADGRSFAVQGGRLVPNVWVYEACPCSEGWRVAAQFAPFEGGWGFPLFPGFPGARFIALSADGNTLAVGAPGASDAVSGRNHGAIHVFGRGDDGVWSQRAKLQPRTVRAFDSVGSHLSISGDGKTIVTKACGYAAFDAGLRRNHPADATLPAPFDQAPGPFCDSEELYAPGGVAYVFERSADAQWSHVAALIPAPGRITTYDYGTMALSADGATLAMDAVVLDEPTWGEAWQIVVD